MSSLCGKKKPKGGKKPLKSTFDAKLKESPITSFKEKPVKLNLSENSISDNDSPRKNDKSNELILKNQF